jgi:ketosteroid isomerase-like protein
MSQENVETIRAALDAMNRRDIDRYLAHCTADVELRPPTDPIEGPYIGPDGVRRYFLDVEDAAPDFHLHADRIEAVGDSRVIGFLRMTATFRTSGLPADQQVTTVYDLVEGKISHIRVFVDRQEALQAVGLAE